jgi:predicted CXXCH cytochrome family protein
MNQTINRIRSIILSFLSILITLLIPLGAWGKHNQVQCSVCHLISEDTMRPYLLENSEMSKSAICLACHDASLDVSGLNPPYVFNGSSDLAGGSFTSTLFSDNTGHNIQTIDGALGLTPPGGALLSEFGCLSCHDAHDNGNFRNLKKEINGYTTLVGADADPGFKNNVYIAGINDFCSACHEKFGRQGTGAGMRGWTRHPVGIAISSAQHADFEHWSRVKDKITVAQLPSGDPDAPYGAEVFCLSCHRAHASSYNDAIRWDYSTNTRGCLECHTF